jgi:hypothetical protein
MAQDRKIGGNTMTFGQAVNPYGPSTPAGRIPFTRPANATPNFRPNVLKTSFQNQLNPFADVMPRMVGLMPGMARFQAGIRPGVLGPGSAGPGAVAVAPMVPGAPGMPTPQLPGMVGRALPRVQRSMPGVPGNMPKFFRTATGHPTATMRTSVWW